MLPQKCRSNLLNLMICNNNYTLINTNNYFCSNENLGMAPMMMFRLSNLFHYCHHNPIC
jgi:hypothetical protein